MLKLFSLILCVSFTFILHSQTTNISFSSSSNGQTFSTCDGFIIDSGGQGGVGYSNNESTIITICSGTVGESISVTFNSFNLNTFDDDPTSTVNLDYMTVYDGSSTSAPVVGTYSGNQLSGVVLQPTVSNISGCLTFKFTSNTSGTGVFTASVSCNIPCNDPIAAGIIVGGITSDSIRVCIGEAVTFNNQGSSAQTGFSILSYKWDFMDGTTMPTENATHSYSQAGLYKVQLFVRDNNPDNVCINNNLISLQVLVATKPDFTGFPKDTTLCIGESVGYTAVPNDYEVQWTGFPNSNNITDGCITDLELGISQDVDLLFTKFISGTTITSVNQIQSVCLDIEHTYFGDIDIKLTCPNGQNMFLHQQGTTLSPTNEWFLGVPVQADGIDCDVPSTIGIPYNYCFTTTATQTWAEWTAIAATGSTFTLPAGDYQPVDPFTNLIGCPTNGIWTLSVIDNWANDDGCVFSLSVNLDPALIEPIQAFTPQIGWAVDSSYWNPTGSFITNITANGDEITVTPTASGTFNYIYTVVDDFGCINDTSVNIIITPQPVLFVGNDTSLCTSSSLQLNGTISGGITPTPTYNYVWTSSSSVSNSTIVNPQFTGTTDQTMVLTISPSNHPLCIVSDDIKITFYTPAANLGPDQIICKGSNVDLTDLVVNPSASYLWSTSETSKTIIVNSEGTFWIKSFNGNCIAYDTINISFIATSSTGQIPNIITTNNDGKNDIFKYDVSNLNSYQFIIVNRWGEKIFETTDQTVFWDGTSKGNPVSDGVYFYLLRYSDECLGDEIIVLDGNITVVN